MILLEFYDLYSSKSFDEGPFASQIVNYMPHKDVDIDIIIDEKSAIYVIERIVWMIDCDIKQHSIQLPVPLINCYVRETNEPKKNRRLGDMPKII